MEPMVKNKTAWYVGGLRFECVQCGQCCSGPAEGYIWVSRGEIKLIADYLKISVEQLRQKYLRRVGFRTTIIEHPGTKDCIFLNQGLRGLPESQRKCMIYPVRPSQCRMWPFWPSNLASPDAWANAARRCPGINHGKLYSFDEIESIKTKKKWWKV